MQKTVVAVILTALIVGGGVYFWQQQKITNVNNALSQTKQSESLSRTDDVAESTLPTTQGQTTSPRQVLWENPSPLYASIDEYVELVLNSDTGNEYKINKPDGFQRVNFGAGDEAVNVAPDGVSASVFVLAKSNWSSGKLTDIQTFYLEVLTPSPCWGEPSCTEPNTVNFYGPFAGELKLLLE